MMLPQRSRSRDIFSSVEPCYFPSLIPRGSLDRPENQELSSTLQLPRPPDNAPSKAVDHEITTKLSDKIQFAFALVLKAYIGSNVLSFGVLENSFDVPEHGELISSLSARIVAFDMSQTATLIQNAQCPSVITLGDIEDDKVLVDLQEFEHEIGSKVFNSTLYMTTNSGSLIERPHSVFDSDLVFHTELHIDKTNLKDEIKISLRSTNGLLDPWSAKNVLTTFSELIYNVISRPNESLQSVNLVSHRDQQQMSVWNTEVPPPVDETLNQQLEKVFQNHAEHEAVFSTAGSFTYAQLDDMSALLAMRLVQLGLTRNMVVPICMDKSRWVTCAMVAIWKAGGAVTTMDPSYPDARLFAMTQFLNSSILISDRTHARRFEGVGMHIISDLDQLFDQIMNQSRSINRSESWRMAGVTPGDLAQVAWTSGSSGQPKAVLHHHNRLTSEHRSYIWNREYNGGQRVLQFGSYAYIAGVNDTFHSMLHGATLCVPSETERTSNLSKFINKARVTRAYLTPSILRFLDPCEVRCLKHLCVGGESIDRDLEKLWSSHLHFISLYGASEGGFMIKQTANPQYLSKGLLPAGGLAWLVDPTNIDKLVPVGALGEIVFESHELALGYLNDPVKTANTFIAPPAWAPKRNATPVSRFLRMGDLGRYEMDGSISIYGRLDNQVKINGQRVELQDVEYHLRAALPTRYQAIVDLVRPFDAPGTSLLTAFCCSEETPIIEDGIEKSHSIFHKIIQEVRIKIGAVLPAHMVPRAFVLVNSMPGGYKTDRRKLRLDAAKLSFQALIQTSSKPGNEVKEPPSTEMEQILAELWTRVLTLDKLDIGKHDSFVALGGDSVSAIRLVSAARAKGINLTTQFVLQHPILSDMAEGVGEAMNLTETANVRKVNTVSGLTTVRATDFQAWAASVGAINGGWIDHFGYDFFGPLDTSRLETSCRRLVAAHPVLRANFSLIESQIHMHIPDKEGISFQTHQAPSLDIEAVSQHIYAKDRVVPLGSSIVRFDLIRASPSRHRLIMRISHTQYDGFCAPIIDEHLRLLYLAQELPWTLPFHDYIQAIHDPVLVSEAERYWTTYMKGSRMPRLVKQLSPPVHRQNILDHEISMSATEPNLQGEGIHTATVVKAAWALVIAALGETTDVVFGDFISGRQGNITGIDTVIGPCVNFTPVRVRMDADRTKLSFLQRVQADLATSIPHESLGFRHIFEHCASWGTEVRYSSIVNFISVDASPSATRVWTEDQDRLEVASIYEEQQHDKTDLWLLCRRYRQPIPVREKEPLKVYLRYSSKVYSAEAAGRIASLFSQVLKSFQTPSSVQTQVEIPVIPDEERNALVPSLMSSN